MTAIDVLVDGRRLPDVSGPKEFAATSNPDAEQEATVSVPIARDGTISLLARAGERVSEAASVKVTLKGAVAADVPKPKLYVLAIGVSNYKDQNLKLDFAAKDAADVAAALKAQQGGIYREVAEKLLTDENATLRNVQDGLDWISNETTSHDVALVFIAGHGAPEEGKYYFLPNDADADRLRRTAEPVDDIKDSLGRIAGKALYFFDTCHSGLVMAGKRGVLPDIAGVVNELSSAENGVVVFAASTGREFAFERESWGHGAFSKALLEALDGRSDMFKDGVITVNGLDYWLAERVKTLTEGHQHPTTAKPAAIPNFPIAAARSG